MGSHFDELLSAIEQKSARVAVIGCGYVGLPLALAVRRAGYHVYAVDTDPEKVASLERGRSYVAGVGDDELDAAVRSGRFVAKDYSMNMGEADVIAICVPTPLGPYGEPDLSAIVRTGERIAEYLRSGQLIILESTTYPGTTEEVLRPVLEKKRLRCGVDYFLAYSPHRDDPGHAERTVRKTPKVVGGLDGPSGDLAEAFYERVVTRVVRTTDARTAEAVKILENVYRAVNIALVNELKTVFHRLGIDTWEVVEAAATKPFGYQPFYPGPGFGGHCIPVDPFYMSHRARQVGADLRFVELAGEVNRAMPEWVVSRLLEEATRRGVRLAGSKVLLIGVAYKPNTADTRESPAFPIMRRLRALSVQPVYHDPHVPRVGRLRHYPEFFGMQSAPLTSTTISECAACLIITDHADVDYASLNKHSRLVIDTRGVMRRLGIVSPHIASA